MEAKDIEAGRDYAVREPARPGVEFQRVKVLEKVRAGRWRVEWIAPTPASLTSSSPPT